MNVTCIFFGIIFTIAGFMFACGKGHIHFSSWKNMPKEEKEKIKIVPLCCNIVRDCYDCMVYCGGI